MHVRPHALFKKFMAGLEAEPQASLVQSLAEPPSLAEFLPDLDPDLSLDWSGKSFFGMPALREHVLGRTGTDASCGIDDVLITAGTAEANFLAISQLVQPGDEMVVDVPGWPQPLVLGEAIGAGVKRLQRREDRAWQFDFDQLRDLVNDRTRLIFLCHPNNPTGQVMSEAELRAVVGIADRGKGCRHVFGCAGRAQQRTQLSSRFVLTVCQELIECVHGTLVAVDSEVGNRCRKQRPFALE